MSQAPNTNALPRDVGKANGNLPNNTVEFLDPEEGFTQYNAQTKYRIFKIIEKITGQRAQDIINIFNEQHTDTPLDDNTLCILFTDADAAKLLLMERKELHTDLRYQLNEKAPRSKQIAEDSGNMQRLPWYKSIFHNPLKNDKYVSNDGHLEGVYDRKTGDTNEEKSVMATFNFFDPNTNPYEHKKADVDPYTKWGN